MYSLSTQILHFYRFLNDFLAQFYWKEIKIQWTRRPKQRIPVPCRAGRCAETYLSVTSLVSCVPAWAPAMWTPVVGAAPSTPLSAGSEYGTHIVVAANYVCNA